MSVAVQVRCGIGCSVVHLDRVPVVGEIVKERLGTPCLVVAVQLGEGASVVWARRIDEADYRFTFQMNDEDVGVPHQDRLGFSWSGGWKPT